MTTPGPSKEIDYHHGPEVFGNTAKIWTAYNIEATKEDQALSRNIREDMNTILVFAGLFSSTLTAFIIESYKNLKPDPFSIERSILAQMSIQQTSIVQLQAMMIQALVHISQQLANETNIPFSADAAVLQSESMINGTVNSSASPFTPTYADFTCNLLWFLSLLACLGCALAACLALQWARHFIQTTESYNLPADRGRIRTYLLRGLRRFNLKFVVDSIPMLLHTSLFLFFGGLFLFLFPVNGLIGGYTLIIFIALSTCYLGFTFLPLFYSDCPYNTPVSNWCWHCINYLRRKGYLRYLGTIGRLVIPTDSTFAEVAHSSATQKSAERDERDSWAMQVAVGTLDIKGELLEFMKEHCTSQNTVQKSRLASLMHSTDLPSRFTRIFGDFRTMMLEDRAEHIISCLSVAEKIRQSQRYYARQPVDGVLPRGYFDGEEHMAVTFAALNDFISSSPELNLSAKLDTRAIKRRLGQYAFGILWRALSRMFENAQTLHDGILKFRLLPAPEAPTADAQVTNELRALTKAQKKELKEALEVFESTQLDPVAEIYPFLDQIAKVWRTFSRLVDRTRVHFESYPAFQTPARDSAIEDTISDYEDLLRHIHYIQLLALFHSASQCFTGELVKEPQWSKCHDVVVENAKELSKLNLTGKARSQAKLANHLQLYFEHRLKWPHRGCRFTLVRENNSRSKDKKPPSYADLHLENPAILLLSGMTGRLEAKLIIDGLKAKLKNDEKESDPNEPGSKERIKFLMQAAGTESLAEQYQQFARGRVIRMAEILDEAVDRNNGAPPSLLEGDLDWTKYREDYSNCIFRE
ncbi:hypothetical protein C0993_007096 [Termitomyces sp. T159_Od127]|nr:hypothetical protein C0993_007096 [Termitomyces sp. T159_Od127]